MSYIKVKNLTHKYDQRKTDGISNISFEVKKSEVFALIGPSGSGKTTTLNCIANTISNYSGEIQFDEDTVVSLLKNESIKDETISLEDFLIAELDHLESEEKKLNQVRTILSQLELTNEIHSPLENISSGQKQRALIAKALVTNPTVLLLDEPFANLDKTLRENLLRELWDLFESKEITVIWVTHNTEEALKYADTIALLNFGKIEQIGNSEDLFFNPNNIFVANFFGENNILPAKVIKKSVEENKITIEFLNQEVELESQEQPKHDDILVMLRSQFFYFNPESRLIGKIIGIHFLGSRSIIDLEYNQRKIFVETTTPCEFKVGEDYNFSFESNYIKLLLS